MREAIAAAKATPSLRGDIDERLNRCKSLPTLPAVAVRIIELSESPTARMEDVANLVAQDPALAVRVLRVSNSPLYAQRRKIDNLRQALALLGLDATLSLALSFSLVGGIGSSKDRGIDLDPFWRRSLVASIAARTLARSMRDAVPETAFLGALLQDLGILTLVQVLGPDYAELISTNEDHDSLLEDERADFGVDHVQAGVWLMGRWNLPDALREAVAASHASDPNVAATSTQQCVAMSGRIADILLSPEPEAEKVQHAARLAESILGQSAENFSELLTTVAGHMPEVENLFDIHVPNADERESILEQAREMLLLRNLRALQQVGELREHIGQIEDHARKLERQVRRDGLTGLFNRATFDAELSSEFERANRFDWPLSILFVDLDHFKQVNDTFGHSVGDEVLVAVSRQLSASLRRDSVLARFGGEEFVLLLPGSDEEATRSIGQRLIDELAGAPVAEAKGRPLVVTASVGLATHGDRERFTNEQLLLKAADTALYEAKRDGRNRLVSYHESVASRT